MYLESIIGDLLLRNNCVVIPGFGGFIATQTAAHIDFSKGIMTSPKKSILFNKQLINNDGLLINAYAHEKQLSYQEAGEKINQQVTIWQKELQAGKRVSFNKIGFLYWDNEQNIHFEQDRFFNLLLQSFGMGQVHFVAENKLDHLEPQTKETPVIKLVPEFKKTGETEEKIIPLVAKSPSTKKLIKYLAAACVLPIAFYSVWIPMKTDVLESGMFSIQDFNPFEEKREAHYQNKKNSTSFAKIPGIKSLDEQIASLPPEVLVYSMELDDAVFFVKIREEKTKENMLSSSTNLTKTHPIKSGNFQVIAGAFSKYENAQALVTHLKSNGFDAYTFPQENGLIRVSAGKASNAEEAQKLIQQLAENSLSAWVLK